MKRLLAVYNTWDDDGYHAMLRAGRPPAPEEKRELSTYKALHGACKGYSVIEAASPYRGRVKMECERGSLEMSVRLWPSDGLIDGFAGTSRDIAPPSALRKVADRLAGLVAKWDEATYRKYLAKVKPHDETSKFFERLRSKHGACTVKAPVHEIFDWKMPLVCERGGDMTMQVTLDAKDPGVVKGYVFEPATSGLCPVK
jgi:hypothetical protein